MATLFNQKFKNIYKIFFFLVFSFLFLPAMHVLAVEKISNFNAQIKINSDSSVLVNETIKYDFGDTSKHGIFRYIPIKYKTSLGNKTIELELQKVTRDGNNENYTISYDGSNETIKIGDANINTTGEHTYNILYKVRGAVGYFDNYDELYWNITGNNWPVVIESVSASIELSQTVDIAKIQSSCYFGILGAKDKCITNISNNIIVASSSRLLNTGEGLTIALGFPKGTVYQPTKLENTLSVIKDNIILLFPIIVFIIMFLIWRKYGKDPKGLSTIIAEYEPPEGMKPTLVGSLVDGRVDSRDITAGLIYLAEQGFLKISRVEKYLSGEDISDYKIELIKNDISKLEKIEKNILTLFFENNLNICNTIKISKLKDFKGIIKDVYQEMADKGFYEKNPNKAKLPYLLLGPVILFLGVFLFSELMGIISSIVSGLIIFIFGTLMNKKTKLGVETRSHILGFKEFLSMTEKDRLDFHNAPEKNPEQFMKFLSYAIALKVEKKWAKQFEGIYISQPTWYHGNIAGSFTALDFVSHMSGFSESLGATAMAGGSGSGGGGFSGGGGGGGGGGSW